MCQKIISFIVSIILSFSFGDYVYSAEKKKNKLAVKQEKSDNQAKKIPELLRSEQTDSGKLIRENWSPGNEGEEFLRYNVFNFLDKKERSKLRGVCKYFNALVEDEWKDYLKDLSSEELKSYLRKAVEAGYTKIVKTLLEHKELGKQIISSKDKYTNTLYCSVDDVDASTKEERDVEEIKEEKERVKTEATELAETFEFAVKKGNEKNLKLLIGNERIREALTYACPYSYCSEGNCTSSGTEDFFKGRGKSRVIKCFIQNERVMYITRSSKGYVELFEMMFDNDDVTKTFQYYHKKGDCKINCVNSLLNSPSICN